MEAKEVGMSRSVFANVVRAGLAVVLLAGLAAVVGHGMVPEVPIWKVVLYGMLSGAAVLAVLVGVAVASSQFRQFILREGGTDSQWFWFSSEPRGLVELRRARRSGPSVRSSDKVVRVPGLAGHGRSHRTSTARRRVVLNRFDCERHE